MPKKGFYLGFGKESVAIMRKVYTVRYLRVLFKDFGKIHKEALFKGNISLYKAIKDSALKDSKFHGQNPIIMPLQFYELENRNWN